MQKQSPAAMVHYFARFPKANRRNNDHTLHHNSSWPGVAVLSSSPLGAPFALAGTYVPFKACAIHTRSWASSHCRHVNGHLSFIKFGFLTHSFCCAQNPQCPDKSKQVRGGMCKTKGEWGCVNLKVMSMESVVNFQRPGESCHASTRTSRIYHSCVK